MILAETDLRFRVGKSTITRAGRGLFARVALAKGKQLEAIGILVRRNSPADLCTHYADCHKFRVGDHLLIPVGYGGMINHSAKANLKKVIRGKKVYLEALRPIRAGEELLFRYNQQARKRLGI